MLNSVVKVVPELLLLVIPGYISLRLKEKYGIEKQRDEFNSILHCLMYSFIIGLIYSIIVALTSKCPELSLFLSNDLVKQITILFLAVLFGLFLTKQSEWKVSKWILKIFNKNLAPDASVWIKAMENTSGAWATVYLKNGFIYTGKLINYTTDPNEELKEILLYDFRLALCCESNSGASCHVLKDNTSREGSKVLLRYDNIDSIEIEPGEK